MKRPLSERQRAVLREHAFRPGHSANPGGRSIKRSVTAELRRLLQQRCPDDAERRTWGRKLAEVLLCEACNGSIAAAELLLNRVEGPVRQPVDFAAPYGTVLTLNSFSNLSLEELDREIEAAREVIRRNSPGGVQ